MAAPQLFYQDPAEVVAEAKATYEGILGKTILPAQTEMLILNGLAARLVVQNSKSDYALSQMLVDTSTAPVLDYLAANAGVTRLAATPSVTTLRFGLVPGHSGITIPAGTRVATEDGNTVFATDVEVSAVPGINLLEVAATSTVDGITSNGAPIGTVKVIMDILPFMQSATNLTVPAAGADVESDEGLRQRIKVASGRYSTAGSVAAYKYHSFTANPSIIDVAVVNLGAGQVGVYPLTTTGETTTPAVLDAVDAALNADTVRPLTDTVVVASPTKVPYELTVNIVLKYGVTQSTTVAMVTDALTAFCLARAKQLGEDITLSQLIAVAMNENVRSVNFGSFTDLVIGKTEFAVCTMISVGTVSYETL